MRRKGTAEEIEAILPEILGAIVLIILLSLFIAFIFGAKLGCFGNQECMEARAELQRFAGDVNKACLNNLGGDISTLGEYDFGAADALAVTPKVQGHSNEFILKKYKGDALSQAVNDATSVDSFYDAFNPVDAATEWQLTATAEDCNWVQQCPVRDNMRVKDTRCGEGPLKSWIFVLLGSSKGQVEYTSFADEKDGNMIKLRYFGDQSMEAWVKDAITKAEKTLEETWQVMIGNGEITEEMKKCGGTCGEEARVTEVCTEALSTTQLTADQVAITANMENTGAERNFMIRIRPSEGVSHALLPCSGLMCDALNWKTVGSNANWNAEYRSTTGTEGVDTRNLDHFKNGYVVQVYREPDGGASSFSQLSLEDRLDAVPIGPDQIPTPEEEPVCIDFSSR